MQLPEKYKENFDVSSEGPSSGVNSGGRENYMSFYTKNIKASRSQKNKPIRRILSKQSKNKKCKLDYRIY
jgi:hypothetical protein